MTIEEKERKLAALNETQRKVYDIVAREEYFNREEVAERISRSTAHVSAIVEKLLDQELIIRQSPFIINNPTT